MTFLYRLSTRGGQSWSRSHKTEIEKWRHRKNGTRKTGRNLPGRGTRIPMSPKFQSRENQGESSSSKVIGGTKLSNQGKVTLWGVHGGEGESEIQRRDWGCVPCSPSPVKLQEFKGKAGAGDRVPESELLATLHPPTPTPAIPSLFWTKQGSQHLFLKENRGLEEDRGAKKSSAVATEENRKGKKGSWTREVKERSVETGEQVFSVTPALGYELLSPAELGSSGVVIHGALQSSLPRQMWPGARLCREARKRASQSRKADLETHSLEPLSRSPLWPLTPASFEKMALARSQEWDPVLHSQSPYSLIIPQISPFMYWKELALPSSLLELPGRWRSSPVHRLTLQWAHWI